MRVWRLCARQHATPDGEGARLFGGRWNPPGTAVVYTSATLSLATLGIPRQP
ncbi:MAG: RES domain-containing protein [Candidatus Methylomirabilis sp.]|nr:RES domain-containing protein [Candidatus Methylomirabilis sp.]